jgi:hypothetical protein
MRITMRIITRMTMVAAGMTTIIGGDTERQSSRMSKRPRSSGAFLFHFRDGPAANRATVSKVRR